MNAETINLQFPTNEDGTPQLEEQIEYLDECLSDVLTSNDTECLTSALIARNRFCRLCLKKSETYLLPLVAKIENITVMEMLLDITGIEMEPNALYPTKVCSKCMTKLDFAFNIRQDFLNSAELLLKMAVEGRLPSFYQQSVSELTIINGASCSDEILNTSRAILESRIQFHEPVQLKIEQSEPLIENAPTDENSQYIADESPGRDILKQQEEQEVDAEADNFVEFLPSGEKSALKPETEKFIYSWKELVKPKKKRQPCQAKVSVNTEKSVLSGINRRGKADAELLQKFPQTTCYICNASHETVEQRDEHFNQHIDMVPHKCESCSTEDEPVISKSVVTLNRHRLMHRLPYKCDLCYRRFISSGSQYTHVWSMHMENKKGLTCDYCGKTFNQRRSFQAHVRRHRYKANGKYKCEECGESCGSSLLLSRHKRKHTGEKRFVCPYCSKSFSRACNLLTHKRIHTNELCHECPKCDKKFRESVSLRRHMERYHVGKIPNQKLERNLFVLTEDGRKQFTCKYEGCTYTTFNSTSISRHKARHAKRYSCVDCGKRFAEPNLVRKHQTAVHARGIQKISSTRHPSGNIIDRSVTQEAAYPTDHPATAVGLRVESKSGNNVNETMH